MTDWRPYDPHLTYDGSWQAFACVCGQPMEMYVTDPMDQTCPTCGREYSQEITVRILTRGEGNGITYTPPPARQETPYTPLRPPEDDEAADFTHLQALPHSPM